MLYGDWGTSRLYVLGIAFTLVGYASIYYVAALSVLMVFVGWAYLHICKIYPDGGGVYSAARHVSKVLSVIGALLLVGDYVVTAALSALDGFHYLGVQEPLVWTIALLLLIGWMNLYGPRRVAALALLIAALTVGLFLTIAAFALPHLGAVRFEAPQGGPAHLWVNFVGIILALSGVESVANMTGIMNRPVARTSALSIWPVLLEVSVVNIVLCLAMSAIPNLGQHTEDMVRVLAQHYVGNVFAGASAIVFALLLFSATNTAIGAIMSVLFAMSRDGELPPVLTRLNRYGVPWVALIIATGVPIVTLLLQGNVEALASLYAIGVAGAITINVGSCTVARGVPLKRWERALMGTVAVVMGAMTLTLAVVKLNALIFAVAILGTGLGARSVAKGWRRFREAYPMPIPDLVRGILSHTEGAEPVRRGFTIAPDQPRLLLATRGAGRALEYAVEEAERRGAALFVLFVRVLAVPFPALEGIQIEIEDDKEAQNLFRRTAELAKEKGVTIVPIYDSGISAADAIVDHAVTLGVKCLIMGIPKRGALWRAMKGDVLQEVLAILPEQITVLIHA